MHDPTKVLLGSVGSSKRVVTCENADPATFLAGLAVRRKADGGLRLDDDSVAALIGVSLGRDLSNAKRTAVCRKGLGVPLRQKVYAASVKIGDITFTAKTPGADGNDISVTLADELSDGTAEVATDPESPLAIVVNIEGGTTDATAIKEAIEADEAANALVSVTIDSGDEAAAQGAAAETPLTGGLDGAAVHGKVVYVNDEGLGCKAGDGDASATLATYNGGVISGVDPFTEAEVNVAVVDMVGGL